MEYYWSEFNLKQALNGTLVGIKNESSPADLSKTGTLTGNGGSISYVTINGRKLAIDSGGQVVNSTPDYQEDSYIGKVLKLVRADMGDYGAVGGEVYRTRAEETGYTQEVTLTVMEPRDQFAINVLNAILIHADHPENFDDATCMKYSDAAYKFAQAMMISAANSRHGASEDPSTTVDVNTGDLQNNTEKLLYNISQSLEKGVIVKGSTELGAAPIQANVTVDGLDAVVDAYTIPDIGTITIDASVFQQKFIRFEVQDYMAYSDVSVYLTLAVKEGTTSATRTVGYIIPKGTVVTIMPLDDAVTEISSISTKAVRGKGGNDPNTYVFAT